MACLETDYKKLVGMYPCNHKEMVKCSSNEDLILPTILLCERKINKRPFDLTVNKTSSTYTLPSLVEQKTEAMLKDYKGSVVYNNINVRIDDLSVEGDNVELSYSFTTYFNSLITNRMMDYPILDRLTIRDLYEPGPFLHSLSDSVLSNHLGFNGFIELSDGKIIFVKRNPKLSIGQNMWSQSVGASLKSMYAVENGILTVEGISNSIKNEIFDELRIQIEDDVDLSKHIFAFYRDIVEGGKPQFLFYYKCEDLDSKTFVEHFQCEMNRIRKQNDKYQIVDGETFAFVSLEELKSATVCDDKIIFNRENVMDMMPSSLASIVLLLNNLD